MADELQGLVDDMSMIKKKIKAGKEYIAILKNAGEDTITAESKLRAVENRAKKWEDSLRSAGYNLPE